MNGYGYDQSIADVLRSTIHDAQDLVRGEIALAKAELRDEMRKVGMGAAALAAAGVTALIGVVFLLTAVAWAIPAAFEWPIWSGFLIVSVVMLAIAGGLAMMGRKRLNGHRYMPLTSETMRENVQWMRARTS